MKKGTIIYPLLIIFLTAGIQGDLLQQNTHQIDTYVQLQMEAANIPGLALAIVHNGDIIHTAGYGTSCADGELITADTSFIIGSISKGITALAIMQLVEAGQVDLDAPVQTYVPWFTLADQTAATRITIRMLLNQNSGLGYNDGTRPLWDQPGIYSLEDRLRQMSNLALQKTPGVEFTYSNYNYMLLGMVVESVSGQPYEQYVQEKIFNPLEMGNSAAALLLIDDGQVADPHNWWFGYPFQVDVPYPQDSVPAGFILSSANDMAAYLAFQQKGNSAILSDRGLIAMKESCIPSGGESEYCFGWAHGKFGEMNTFNHEGAAQGYYAVIAHDPISGWGIVVLSNANQMLNAPAKDIGISILAYLTNEIPLTITKNFQQTAMIMDVLLVLLTGLIIWSLIRVPNWGTKLSKERPQRLKAWILRVFLPILAEFILPFLLWIFLPKGAGFPMWKVMAMFQPDLTAWIFLVAVLFVVRGFLRTWLAYVNLKKK